MKHYSFQKTLKSSLAVFLCLLIALQISCRRTEEIEPSLSTPAPVPDLICNFWYYTGGHYEWGNYTDTLLNPPNQFLHLTSEGIANVGLAELFTNTPSGCSVYQTTYRRFNDKIYLRYNACLPGLTDSLLYVTYLSQDSLVLRTRGIAHNNMNNNPDSIYYEYYFYAEN
jgi:hypothetical protein